MLIPIGGVCSIVKQLREVRQGRIGSILGGGTVVQVIVIVPLRKSMLIWKPRKKSRPSKPSTWDVGGRVWQRTEKSLMDLPRASSRCTVTRGQSSTPLPVVT
jgi:hypothetical protein